MMTRSGAHITIVVLMFYWDIGETSTDELHDFVNIIHRIDSFSAWSREAKENGRMHVLRFAVRPKWKRTESTL
jgi:hypothetical protein